MIFSPLRDPSGKRKVDNTHEIFYGICLQALRQCLFPQLIRPIREIAPFYCDVIDTTTIENFSKCLSHRITQNVILEGTCCKREYFESDKVKRGEYTYGKKKKTKNKKRFTWVNLAQLLTVAALLLWMQWAVDSGRVLTIFVASPTFIVEEGIKIITDGTLWPHLLLTIQEALAGYLSAVVVGIAVGLLWTLFPVSEKYIMYSVRQSWQFRK